MTSRRTRSPGLMEPNGQFCTTHWSVVVSAGQGDLPQATEAMEKLCSAYWYPLYVYVRRQGNSPEDAEDLTQEFFYRLLDRNSLAKADRDRGKFRTFLLGSLKNFMVNDWRRAGRLKRGGGLEFLSMNAEDAEDRYAVEAADEPNPDSAYDRRWAATLIERVLTRLREEHGAPDKARLFEALIEVVWGNSRTASYAEIAERLGLSEGALKVSVHRLRRRFQELLRTEVAQTVARPEDIDGELRHLISVAV